MSHNRITSYQVAAQLVATGVSSAASPLGSSTAMVAVTLAPQAITWQQTLYQMAYQKAVAQLAPPRHHSRFFSVWN
ncbi:MAG TPA: hypothetical protein VL175_09705 [Pirellulales bacterium]|jgi:hypothetical protein|nr:hypothetical protein [Pirellulales bacterium]